MEQGEGRAKILLVDDRPENLVALEALLQPLDLELVLAKSGLEALKEILRQDFALILLDVQMPGMDGFKTASLIKEREKSQTIPIIFVTANNRDEEFVAEGYQAGAVDYIQKPFHPEILKSKVKVFVDLYTQNEQIRRQTAQIMEAEVREAEQKLEQAHLAELQESYRFLKNLEAERNELTHMIVHDLRTPLTSLIAALASFEPADPEAKEFLEIATHSGNNLLRMINNLLDVAKFESGAFPLHPSKFEAGELIDSAVREVAYLVAEKHIEIETHTTPQGAAGEGDDELLRRVLVNLLGNAVKFSPEGSSIKIEAVRNGELVFKVSDTGAGIPDASKALVFEKFQQLGAQKSSRKISTGLGLTFCKRAVEAHQGRIWVEDNPMGGASFVFALPQGA